MDEETMLRGANYGVITRQAVAAQAEARYLPAVFATISGGVEGTPVPAIGAVLNPVWDQWLPQIVTGDMSAAELLDAAADAYRTEATAQGFIEG